MSGVEHAHGAASRRRQRRVRQHWRHEQLTLQMVLATVEHHSHGAPRGQTTATRTRAEERETNTAPWRQKPPLPTDAGAQYFSMSDDESVPVGVRPPCLGEPPGPAVRVGRGQQPGTLEQPSLDVPVLRMVDQMVEVSLMDCVLVPRMAEEVVEVSKKVSQPVRQQHIVEQFVNIPVPGRGFGYGGLHGFLPRQDSTAVCREGGGGLHRFLRGQDSTAFCRDGGPGGGLQDFLPVQGSGLVDVLKALSQDRVQLCRLASPLQSSRLSTCPLVCPTTPSRSVQSFVRRSWWSSWWKCPCLTEMVVLARGRSALGLEWCQVAAPERGF